MARNDLLELCKSIGISIDDSANAFHELKRKGFIYTPARTAKEFASRKYPVRLIGMPPSGLKKFSEVSFGPFPVDRQTYESARSCITNQDAFRVLLGFLRLSYEKTGGTVRGYRVVSKDNPLYQFLGLMDMWDVADPEVFEEFVWIPPNHKAKTAVEKLVGKKFGPRDFTWWNLRLDLGKQFEPTILDDYPEAFSIIPNELINTWGRYLPTIASSVLIDLFIKMTPGGIFKPFTDLDDLVHRIGAGIVKYESKILDTPGSFFDREFLIKELCDYNKLTYPTDAVSMLEFFQQLGFINVAQRKREVQYSLTAEVSNPKTVLKIPKKWEERMNLFLENGSVIFSYLKIDEIVAES